MRNYNVNSGGNNRMARRNIRFAQRMLLVAYQSPADQS